MIKKLRKKFICFTMALVFIMLCVIFGTIYGFTANSLEADSLQMMHAMSGPPGIPGENRPEFKVPYLVIQYNGSMDYWTARGSNHYDLTDQAFLTGLLEAAIAQDAPDGVLDDYDMRFLRNEFPVTQYVFLDISAERTTLSHLVKTCVGIGGASLLAFFGLSLLLANWALKPLEAAWEQQRQFIADASHELKTPLAVILTNAEQLPDESYSPQEQQQFKQNILTMSLHMRHLVESLLELARLDNVVPEMEPVQLSQLTETALLPFEPVFFENGTMLESSILPGLWVKGNASHLQQVLEIFLDNARKYAEPGPVTVKLDKAGNHALLQVENIGTPLSSQEAKDIFHRFYRADAARKRDGSYGLGLSIAQKITQQHEGKIWAEATATGNRFSLLLPLCHKDIPRLSSDIKKE